MELSKLVLSDEALNVLDNGAWVGGIEGAEGVELFVCGMSNADVQKALVSAQAAVRASNKGALLTHEQLSAVTRQVLATHVLKNWRGITDGGKEVPYSAEQAKQWITSRNGERFADLVLVASRRIDEDAGSYVEAVAKN